jgi:hypothetical protein
VLLAHVNRTLDSYKTNAEKYGKAEDKRRCRVIMALYIEQDAKTVEEISAIEHVDKRTIYRDIDIAAEQLAVLLFGVFGLRFF